ncbi:MAG: hypothetical protein JNL83_21325 [Myxococcales bacterium]|nr:hypothetical protein [Myxococcales bacterium]
MDCRTFGEQLGPIVHGIVRARHEAERDHFLTSMIVGASFEGWLSFETRFALEKARPRFGLDHPRFWIGNEYKKVDLGIVEYDDEHYNDPERWLAAIEFKVIYNNKNWEAQVNGVLADLFPKKHGREDKAAIVGPDRQLAVVAMVQGNFPSNKYQRELDRDPSWESRVREALGLAANVQELSSSPEPLSAGHANLASGESAKLTVHVLAPHI